MHFLKATQLFSGKEFLPEDSVLISDDAGSIVDLISEKEVESSKIEYLEGILTPGFVNTHCHLELSHLKDKIARGTGIVDFGLEVIKQRNQTPLGLQVELMKDADKAMFEQGIVAVGDISNTIDSIEVKKKSKLQYHTFVELIALNPERANLVFDAGKAILEEYDKNQLSVSLAPHAPYTASVDLIKLISDDCYAKKKPTSIHNQESEAENEFFNSKTGDYLRLYETLNIPIDYFKESGKSSLQMILQGFNVNVNTLLVHNTFSKKEDVEIVEKYHSNLFWCLCPHANLYIENTLPNVALLQANNCGLTIGTDSLASNSTLSIAEELNILREHQSNIKLEILLKAATYNGAKFLGLESHLGFLEKGKKPGINLLKKTKKGFSVKRLF
jgi:cytosine/adenosine deaminase-related metal-dependent hydrolase